MRTLTRAGEQVYLALTMNVLVTNVCWTSETRIQKSSTVIPTDLPSIMFEYFLHTFGDEETRPADQISAAVLTDKTEVVLVVYVRKDYRGGPTFGRNVLFSASYMSPWYLLRQMEALISNWMMFLTNLPISFVGAKVVTV